jgi:hypothetical protein
LEKRLVAKNVCVMTKKYNLASLLHNTKLIIKHNREKEILKGEKFNIFSILGLEHYENTTHSAFLGELLNPQGSHLKGNIFLKYFLDQIDVNFIDINTAKVYLEHSIGARNDKEKSGGRIDIFIEDEKKNAIAIENKIYAGDQNCQIERYYNYKNPGIYKIFYLNLYGDNPSEESAGALIANQDYFIISYKETIIDWLKICHKESSDLPILRETIRQYILLIKKLTKTMEQNEEKELIELMFNHYEEASFIASNFIKAQQNISEDIRIKVMENLKNKIDDDFDVVAGKPTSNIYSQIWIKIKKYKETKLQFGIESFSGKGWREGDVFIGLFNNNNSKEKHPFSLEKANENSNISTWWIDQKYIGDFESYKVNFSNSKLISKLYMDPNFKEKFINFLVEEILKYISIKYKEINKFYSINE